jgi:hypothetical protein
MSVGPVIFSDDTARAQLVEDGEVVTFRTSERTTGSTWCRETRTGPKKGDCHIERIGAVDAAVDGELAPFRDRSGFDSVEAWRSAIRSLNGNVGEGILYRVRTTDDARIVAVPGGEDE